MAKGKKDKAPVDMTTSDVEIVDDQDQGTADQGSGDGGDEGTEEAADTESDESAIARAEAEGMIGEEPLLARIEGGALIPIEPDEVRAFRLYRDGVAYDHVGEETVGGHKIWVYRVQRG